MKDWNDATKWTEEDWKDLISKPEPADDPEANNEFEQWVYFENGEWVNVRRKNPRYRKTGFDDRASTPRA